VLITSRKLRHYFQEYPISVVTDYPLGDILRNQDATGRISKWVVELDTLNIDFKPRTTIKSQALVDFMVEWRENQLPTPTKRQEHWVMYFDGSLKLEGAGAGVLLISPTGEQLKYVLQIIWKVSNNKAEYEVLLHGSASRLQWASSGYYSTATPQWSSTKSTSPGTATRRTWTPTA
jgi:hypothetical protein